MTDFIADFFVFLRSAGFDPAANTKIIPDDKVHRFCDSNSKKSASVYQFKIENNYAVGWAHSFKTGHTETFTSKTERKLSREERDELKRVLDLRKAQEAANKLKAQAEAQETARKLMQGGGDARTEYEARKQIKRAGGAVSVRNKLLVPVYNGETLANVQTIYPSGDKYFLKGGMVRGCYLLLGSLPERGSDVVLCEGYATGCTLLEALGGAVIVCFNAGNLLTVAKRFSKKYNLTIAADNDAATVVNGQVKNIGILAAQEVAETLGGRVCVPSLSRDASGVEHPARSSNSGISDRSIDFNDIHVEYGISAVREFFAGEIEEYHDDYHEPEEKPDRELPFRVLGYDSANYYYLPKAKGKIVSIASSAHTMANLIQIAPLEYWRQNFGDGQGGDGKAAIHAANSLLRACEAQGIFDANDRLRGVGVWRDEGRIVVHAGDVLYVNKQRQDVNEIASKYVYEIDRKALQFTGEPLGNREAVKLRDICESLSWENPLSGALLAGWLVVAPVCAALHWRPHIWISGESGSGKTTVLENIISPVLGATSIRVDGGTTEPALRQMLGHSGRPVIYDEAESETRRDSEIMANILQLARRSSSGGTIAKWGQNGANVTTVRSSFCFSAINPSLRQRADESRVSMLNLKKRNEPEKYEQLLLKIEEVLTPDFSERLLSRTVGLMDILLKNCHAFTSAAALELGDRRAADQVGTMLAGLYLLSKNDVITTEKAREWIRKHDWTLYTSIGESSDFERLISAIAMHRHRFGTHEVTIGGLIACALGDHDRMPAEAADYELKNMGIKVEEDKVIFSNTSEQIRKILSDTPWAASWKRSLSDIPGAEKTLSVYFSPGHTSRGVAVPAKLFRE